MDEYLLASIKALTYVSTTKLAAECSQKFSCRIFIWNYNTRS